VPCMAPRPNTSRSALWRMTAEAVPPSRFISSRVRGKIVFGRSRGRFSVAWDFRRGAESATGLWKRGFDPVDRGHNVERGTEVRAELQAAVSR